ncbi:spermidine/putrescine ABC transporter substrate-binding protein [Candidatus Babeliales bacterium]|nr:spermidine/putrescine ABC transporter substrate-binding protein [Candidatus Babeliales bacterium]
MNEGVAETKNFWISFLSKIFIVIFYFLILILFLYIPKIFRFMISDKKVINVYVFSDIISYKTVKEFEKKTGISVNLKYFDANNELISKFRINKGKGYDLITVSDFAVDILRSKKLLQKIDISKISNFKYLDKRFLGKYFDPKNDYSVPCFWSLYGIIYNKNKFKILEDLNVDMNWSFVFKDPKKILPQSDYKICMIQAPRDSIYLAAIHLFGKVDNLSEKELEQIRELLIEQKRWVEIYMLGSLQYYLLGEVVSLAVTESVYAQKILEISDEFDFVVPKEGSVFSIENLAIPVLSEKSDLSLQFIDFLISKEVCLENSLEYGYNPVNVESCKKIGKKILEHKSFFPEEKMFDRLHLVPNDIGIKRIEKLWSSIKLS